MNLTDLARQDMIQIMGDKDTGFAVDITLITPDGETELVVQGIHTKTHMDVDALGQLIDTKKAHVSFTEKQLTDAEYPCRNAAGDMDLKEHRVTVKDSTETEYTYVIEQWFPDEHLGLIVCILTDYANG